MSSVARALQPSTELESREEQIQRRAYELYMQRGNQAGSELEDWLQAEAEIRTDLQEQPEAGEVG